MKQNKRSDLILRSVVILFLGGVSWGLFYVGFEVGKHERNTGYNGSINWTNNSPSNVVIRNNEWFTATPSAPETNMFPNGLEEWAADTNHTFGPRMAKRIFVMQFPDSKFYVRAKQDDGLFYPVFENDHSYKTDNDARSAILNNLDLMIDKRLCDALEDALRVNK